MSRAAASKLTVFGIRHHGPGCARSVRAALAALRPDLVLIEGPAETDAIAAHAAHAQMRPPVAVLIYDAKQPQRASFYPYAEFSPEWQALRWALAAGVPVRHFDLPGAHALALRAQREAEAEAATDTESPEDEPSEPPAATETVDPFAWFAQADGYGDGERWWNDKVEERGDDASLFAAILEAVTALRQELALAESPQTLLREAWMRRAIRKAQREGFAHIAVVCGAWHAPALLGSHQAGDDAALVEGLPKTDVRATWVPWSNQRLTRASGYGAGVQFPGWYEHLWSAEPPLVARWLTKVARALREHDVDASSASVIEAVRLADALAGLRGRPRAGFAEVQAAATAALCGGDPAPLQLIHGSLLVGEALGALPPDIGVLPLQADVEKLQRSLRLPRKAVATAVELDLREPLGQQRSAFLHRLLALRIDWGTKQQTRGRGTFKETWSLLWQPELELALVDAAAFGNTVEQAAHARLLHELPADDLDALVQRLDLGLLADLPAAATALFAQVDAAGARIDDPRQFLRAIPRLVQMARYGSVRPTDATAVAEIVRHASARALAGLGPAASGIDDASAGELVGLLAQFDAALQLLDDQPLRAEWHEVAVATLDQDTAHARVRGYLLRLLREAQVLPADAVCARFGFALSAGQGETWQAAWVEGFLAESGAVLVHDASLLALVDQWVAGLTEERFLVTLPLVRRTFATFAPAERRKIGEALASGPRTAVAAALELDAARAAPAIAAVARLLGMSS